MGRHKKLLNSFSASETFGPTKKFVRKGDGGIGLRATDPPAEKNMHT